MTRRATVLYKVLLQLFPEDRFWARSQNLHSVGKIYVAAALLCCIMDSVPAFWVKLGANDLNCVDVPLNRTHSDTHSLTRPDLV